MGSINDNISETPNATTVTAAGQPLSTAPTNGPGSGTGDLQSLEIKLQEYLDSLLKLCISVYDFQPDCNQVVHRRVNDAVKRLGELDAMKHNLDVRIPVPLIDFIEDGRNPDVFIKDTIQSMVDKNQKTAGKIKSLTTLESCLESELERNYPDLLEQYRQIMAAPPAVPPSMTDQHPIPPQTASSDGVGPPPTSEAGTNPHTDPGENLDKMNVDGPATEGIPQTLAPS
ncbi:Mediator of RNA polymerase II transcription subunit 10 [Quaeritorhiza haematococci]|nr:Mediator of RNA polymerase II transcription subunit 10 [Quaeritorhiza haematococci]